MNKKLIISFVLGSALCAPFVHAMSLLPRARQVAAMVMNPSVRSTLTQAGKSGAQEVINTVAPQAERRLMTFTQPTIQSTSKKVSNVAKPITNQTRSTLAQKCALGMGGVGLAYAIDNDGIVQASDGTYVSLFAKLWAAMVGTAAVEAIMYGEQEFPTKEIFLKKIAQNPDYARELAEKVTHENIFELNPELVTEIVKFYPAAKEQFAAYLTSNPVQFFKGLHRWYFGWYIRFADLCIELMRDNPEAAALFEAFAVEHFEKMVDYPGREVLAGIVHYYSPALITESAVKHFAYLIANGYRGCAVLESIVEKNPESVALFTSCLVEHFATLQKTPEGKSFIKNFKWIINDPKRAALCAPVVAENITLLAGTPEGVELMNTIMVHNGQTVPLFIESAVKHSAALMSTELGIEFIKDFIDCSYGQVRAERAALFAPCVAENIVQLASTSRGNLLLRYIRWYDPNTVALFTESVVKNLDALMGTAHGAGFIAWIADSDSNSMTILTPYIAQRAESFVNATHGVGLLATIAGANRDAAALITPVAIKHCARLVKSEEGLRLLINIENQNPESAALLTADTIKNITRLPAFYYGAAFAKHIMRDNPESKALFTQATCDNFVEIAKQNYGYEMIEMVMALNDESKAEIINLTVKNFKSLVEDINGRSSLDTLTKNPELAARCTELTVDAFMTLANFLHGHSIIKNIMQHNATPLIEAGAKNIVAMMQDHTAKYCLEDMMVSHPQSIPMFAAAAAQNLTSMLETAHGCSFIKDIIKKDTQASALITKQAVADCVQLAEKDNGLQLLMLVMKSDPEARKELQEKFKESSNQDGVSQSPNAVREIFYRMMRSEDVTPTELGFMYNRDYLRKDMKAELENKAIQRVVNEVIAIEREYQKTHYTFVHGRNFAYNLREMVYRNLWEYAHNTKVPADFRFTHTKEEHDPLMKEMVIMPEEKKLHERNITELKNKKSEELRNRRLFMNYQLFGNQKAGGSNTFKYFINNNNASGWIRVSIEDIFGQFGQKELYAKYKDRFEALDREHRALTEYGELLVVAVPRDRVGQDVQTIDVHGDPAGIKTLDVLQARETDPSFRDNELNFTLAMTDTAALDPKSGIKVRSVHAVDPAKYAAWQAKYDALMHELESEFKAAWNQSHKAKERGHKELLDVVGTVKKHSAKHKTQNGVNK